MNQNALSNTNTVFPVLLQKLQYNKQLANETGQAHHKDGIFREELQGPLFLELWLPCFLGRQSSRHLPAP